MHLKLIDEDLVAEVFAKRWNQIDHQIIPFRDNQDELLHSLSKDMVGVLASCQHVPCRVHDGTAQQTHGLITRAT